VKLSAKTFFLTAVSALAFGIASTEARADETLKFGLSVPLSGSGAVYGRGAEWLCKKAAAEIKESGGVKVKGQTYNFECQAYDNKYTAAEGTKVAQTAINRDGVKYLCAVGTAPILAAQTLTERSDVYLFNQSWGTSSKGPQFPLTVSITNTPVEFMPAMVKFITKTYPQAKTIALLNVNDATGREIEATSRPLWEKAGIKVVTSDFYERGTTEFQPVAARLAAYHADIVDVSSAPPADAGQVFKELEVLGVKAIKVVDNGLGVDGLKATGGPAVNGVYMGAAMTFDSDSTNAHQKMLNQEVRAYLGEALGPALLGCYDAVYMAKAAMEKAQSTDPKDMSAVMPTVKYKSFYGDNVGFGGKAVYGVDQAPKLPVFITQIVDGKLVDRAKIEQDK
jgi:branched-chain amino acid transport system substrate-binding protein